MVQISSVAAGVSSFCFPGCKVPAWFVQQNSAVLWQFSCLHIALVVSYWVSCCALLLHLNPLMMTLVDSKLNVLIYHFKNDHADPCVLHCYFASCYGSLQKQSIRSDHLFLDIIRVWMLQKIFGMVNSVKSQLNSPWKIWTTTPCIIVMWESVGSANYTPKQRTIAILSCHTVRYLQQLQRNLDSLYNNSLMLVGGKT